MFGFGSGEGSEYGFHEGVGKEEPTAKEIKQRKTERLNKIRECRDNLMQCPTVANVGFDQYTHVLAMLSLEIDVMEKDA